MICLQIGKKFFSGEDQFPWLELVVHKYYNSTYLLYDDQKLEVNLYKY